jgi:hypothetical protein
MQRFICSWRLAAVTASAVAGVAVLAGPAWAAPSAKTGGGWSAQTAISGINQPDPTRGSQLNDVAINAAGQAIAAWDQFSYSGSGSASIGAAVRSGGRWGTPFIISGTSGFAATPKVAVGADGTMAVSWIFQDSSVIPARDSVQVAVRPSGSPVWTTSTLASFTVGGVSVTRSAPVGIDATGDVFAAWNVWDGTRNVVQAATKPSGQGWSAPATLSGATADGLYLSLAVNARGDAAVAYTISPYSGYQSGTWAEYVSRPAATGTRSAPVKISETISSSVGYVTSPVVALDGNGRATVIYLGNGLEATRQLVGGTWTKTPATVITSPVPGATYQSPDLAVDGKGNAVAAVAIFDPTINVDRSSVWVVRGTPDGAWTAQQRLTDPAVPVDAYASRVAMSPAGGLALVGWIDHYHGVVQVSRLVNGAWGAPATIGKGTAWASFQEVMGLDAGSDAVAAAIWKNAKTGTQTMASAFSG